MDCQRIKRNTNYADFWHRLICSECRAARKADRKVTRAVGWLKLEAPPREGIDLALAAVGLSHTVGLRKRNAGWKTLKRLSLPASIVMITITLMGCSYLWWIEIPPQITIPSQVMPARNAFDLFNRAGQLISTEPESREISDALMSAEMPPTQKWTVTTRSSSASFQGVSSMPIGPMPGGTNAPTMNRSMLGTPPRPVAHPGVESQQSVRPGTAVAGGTSDGFQSTAAELFAEKQYILDKYRPALDLFRQGLSLEYVQPPVRSASQSLSYLSTFRSLARLLALEATVRIHQGNYAGAVDSYLDAMQMGVMIPHGGVIISRLVGTACEGIGRQPLWKLVNHLNAKQALHAVERLEQIDALRLPFAETLAEEKWSTQSNLLYMLRQPGWRTKLGADMAGVNGSRFLAGAAFYLQMLPYSKRQILKTNTRFLDAEINQAWAPWKKDLPSQINESQEIDKVNELLLPTFTQGRFIDMASTKVQDHLLLATLALRAYRLEHGKYPEHLSDLKPHYLKEIPMDPFAFDLPLRYIRMDRGRFQGSASHDAEPYRLYSIGPDQVDDFGKPIMNSINAINPLSPLDDATKKKVFMIHPNSAGDIVAGVNLQAENTN